MTDFTATPLTPEQQAETTRLERQAPLSLTIPRGVAVVGCGGVGSWIAWFLALAGVSNLWLFDPDTVSENNLNRLLLPPSAIGKPKTNALAEAIAIIRPSIKCVSLASFTPELASSIHLDRECSYIACSTDSWRSRRTVHKWCHENNDNGDYGITYIEAAAEGDTGSIAGTPADFATPDEDRPGYQSVPVWVGPCVHAAAMACTYILREARPERDDVFRIGFNRDTWSVEFYQQAKHTPTPILRGTTRVPHHTMAVAEIEFDGVAMAGQPQLPPRPTPRRRP